MPVDDHLRSAIDALQRKLEPILPQIEEGKRLMKAINAICEVAGDPPIYPDAGEAASGVVGRRYSRTEFFKTPFAEAVRRLLQDHPDGLTDEEIYDKLTNAGYQFKDANSEKAKAGMRIALGKYMQFSRLRSGVFVNDPDRAKKAARGRAEKGKAAEGSEQPVAAEQESQEPAADEAAAEP